MRWRGPASSCIYPYAGGIAPHRFECMRALGTHVSPQGDYTAEFRHLLRKAWASYHSRRRIWATPGCIAAEMRISHLSVLRA